MEFSSVGLSFLFVSVCLLVLLYVRAACVWRVYVGWRVRRYVA